MSELSFRMAFGALKRGFRVPKQDLVEKFIDNGRLITLVKELEIDWLIDVGANKGQFAEKMRSLGYKGRIISVEPIPADGEIIRGKIANDDKWELIAAAIDSEAGERTFNLIEVVPGYTVFSSFSKLQDIENKTTAIQVRTIRLEEVIRDILDRDPSARIFLKMDTQGHDLEVFKSAGDRTSNLLGVLCEIIVRPLYETQSTMAETLTLFAEKQFSLVNLSVANREKNGVIMEFDALYVRR